MKSKLFITAIVSAVILVFSSNPIIYDKTSLYTEYVAGKDTVISFKKDVIDKLPDGFTQTATEMLQKLNWKIINDNGNKVIAQLAKNEGDYYNLLVLDKLNYQDFTLTVKMKGNKISCSLNGIKMIEATDDIFKSPGYIGLWTKADAVTYFDDFTIHSF